MISLPGGGGKAGSRFLFVAACLVVVVHGLRLASPVLLPFSLALFLAILSVPLMLGLHTFMGRYSTDWTLLMAASVMAMVPVILVFLFGQRYFEKGIVMSGIKG